MANNIEQQIRLFGAMNGGCVLVILSLLFGAGTLMPLSLCLYNKTKVRNSLSVRYAVINLD